MIITGKNVGLEKYLQNLKNPVLQIQPAGIDLSVRSVYAWGSAGLLDFNNKRRKLPKISTLNWKEQELFLPIGGYFVEFRETIKVPADAVAFLYPRSSLMRCGAVLNSSLFDPGYSGPMAAVINVVNPHGLKIQKQARIATCIFVKTEKPVQSKYQGKYHKKVITAFHK